ncbi:MAG TPA: alpha/beta hydrolase [Gemmatimonadaceae bacterium]|jgi:acetyl esterase/lipase
MISRTLRAVWMTLLLAACSPFHSDAQMIQYDELIAAPAPHATKRVQYGSGPLQFGELFLPTDAANTKRATIVFIHGGCWMAEYTLDHVAYAAAALASAGYVVWVPEYRRIGDDGGGWPGTFDDIGNAIDFVRTLAKSESSIDTARVIVSGHSAGGQLALWAATRSRDVARAGARAGASATPLAVRGVVSLAGITDLATYGSELGGCNASVTPLLGGKPSVVAERYRAVSPIERLPIGVPTTLVHGDRDPIVPVALTNMFAARAKAAGDKVTVTTITGVGHFDLIAPQTRAWPAVIAAFQGISPPR